MPGIDTSEQDREDMARLASGHDAALSSLMERHAGPVFQFLFRMLNNEEDANDLAQEAFVRVYRYRERYDGGKFTTWLYAIAGNLARTEYRRRMRHPNVSLDAENEEHGGTIREGIAARDLPPGEAAVAAEKQQAVRAAVQALPEELREAVILCEWQEMSAADAAAILQTTARGVESRLYRARKILREALKNWL